MKHRMSVPIFGVLLLLLSIGAVSAQAVDCPELVKRALTAVANVCTTLGRNEACYGNDRLQAELGGDRFQVVTIATGRNPIPAIQKLFAEEKITGLPILRDPDQSFSRASGVLALPVTLIVDRDGNEIARLLGDATWDGPEAKALIAALVSSP